MERLDRRPSGVGGDEDERLIRQSRKDVLRGGIKDRERSGEGSKRRRSSQQDERENPGQARITRGRRSPSTSARHAAIWNEPTGRLVKLNKAGPKPSNRAWLVTLNSGLTLTR